MKSLRQLEIEWGNSKCGRSSEQFIYDYFTNEIEVSRKEISIKFAEYIRDRAWENEYRDQRTYTLREHYEIFANEKLS